METTIGDFNSDTRTVPVTFTAGDVVHSRDVNACLDDDGGFDEAATKERVDQVAQGVAHKIAVGAICKTEPAPVPESDVTDATVSPALGTPTA